VRRRCDAELYYIYTSVWGHNSYTLWGILALVFLILIVVTACITIALTYFQLSMEDYRWWWRSFASGGSTGVFIFVHSFFYYAYRYVTRHIHCLPDLLHRV
jgi:hypothetical protein